MNMYKILSIFTSLLCLYLFYLLLFSASSFLQSLGVEETESAFFVSRRAAMLMLGISVLMFFTRNAPNTRARQAICLSIGVTMLGLAFCGIYEFNRQFVGSGIIGPIVVELILSASFFYVWFVGANEHLAV